MSPSFFETVSLRPYHHLTYGDSLLCQLNQNENSGIKIKDVKKKGSNKKQSKFTRMKSDNFFQHDVYVIKYSIDKNTYDALQCRLQGAISFTFIHEGYRNFWRLGRKDTKILRSTLQKMVGIFLLMFPI